MKVHEIKKNYIVLGAKFLLRPKLFNNQTNTWGDTQNAKQNTKKYHQQLQLRLRAVAIMLAERKNKQQNKY